MASADRSDHQLMRQRGAGLRNAENVEFGLEFGGRDSRKDRQLMRQRGAGLRDMGNVDFGFSFPTPSSSRRSSRTPQTLQSSIERNQKTPREQSSSVHSRQIEPAESDPKSKIRRASETPQRVTYAEKPNSGKRRRLNKSIGDRTPSINVNIPPLSRPVADEDAPRVLEERKPNITTEESPILRKVNASDDREQFYSSEAAPVILEDDDKENTTEKLQQLLSARKSSIVGPSYHNAEPGSQPQSPVVSMEPMVQSVEDDEPELTHSHDNDSEIKSFIANKKNAQVRKRKKRKSVVLGRKKRRSSEVARGSVSIAGDNRTDDENSHETDVSDVQASSPVRNSLDQQSESEQASGSARSLWNRITTGKIHNRRNRLSMSMTPMPQEQDTEEGDETYIEQEASPEAITPAAKKTKKRSGKVKQARKATSATSKETTDNSQSEKTFPIVTHRMTNVGALPTITEEDEDIRASDEDTERMPAAFTSRPQPNAADVLAQLFRETIESASETLEASEPATTSKAEIKHKRTALEAFGANLDQRLFDLSEATEQRMNLEARLRKSKREKAELQARWIEVRRQRDELAQTADTIRLQNWEREAAVKRQWDISELAHNTTLELERDVADDDDLEFMIKQIAGGVVGGKHRQDGILNRVKSFNSQLEKLALKLEGR